MTLSLLTMINQVQTLTATIAGVKRAPQVADYVDRISPEVDLPYAFTWSSGGVFDWQAISQGRDDETLTISVLVAPVGQGLRGSIIAQALTLLDAFRTFFLLPVNQGLNDTIDHLDEITHGGLRTLTYAGIEYYGFQLTMGVCDKDS